MNEYPMPAMPEPPHAPFSRDEPGDYDPSAPVAALRPDPATVDRFTMTDDGPVPTHQVNTDVAGEDAHRRLLDDRPANLDSHDRPHFLRVLDNGDRVCGQDGEPWECAAYTRMVEEDSGGRHKEAHTADLTTMEEVAEALGMDRAALDEALTRARASRREAPEPAPWGSTR